MRIGGRPIELGVVDFEEKVEEVVHASFRHPQPESQNARVGPNKGVYHLCLCWTEQVRDESEGA